MIISPKLLILTCLILATVSSALALSPTQIEQILTLPTEGNLMPKLWHIGDDIVGFYGFGEESPWNSNETQGYLRISPKTSQVKRILDDTRASCYNNISYLDRSYYHAPASTLLYYCVNNNSLLLIETKSYTVRDVILVSTSQTFEEAILGHNEEGQIYILGLPDITSLPTTSASELILVNLTTKAVENHVVFNKGSDSQLLVTGYAFDSGSSYILTKGAEKDQTLIEIKKIVLKENDYELTPFVNFTFNTFASSQVHTPLDIIDGYFFTNDHSNLLIFDKNGDVFDNKTMLQFKYYQKKAYSEAVAVPVTGAQIGGSIFYVQLRFDTFGYSLKDGAMISSKIGGFADDLRMAFGDGSELLVISDLDTFSIIEMATNTTLYTSLIYDYYDLMASGSYYFGHYSSKIYVFDRKTPGKLLQTLTIPIYSVYDKATNLILQLSPVDNGCQISYLNLETLTVSQGPLVKNKDACGTSVSNIDITDTARPFFIVHVNGKDKYLFVSPATYGTALFTNPFYPYGDGIVMPEKDGESFSFVKVTKYDTNKNVEVHNFKLNKLLKRFIAQDNYNLTTIIAESPTFGLYQITNNKVIMTYNDTKMTILDLALRNAIDYDIPAFPSGGPSLKIFSDKNKTPYVILSQDDAFGMISTLPQLFDLTNITPLPGAISNITRKASEFGACGYYVSDEYHRAIGVIRFFDACSSTQSKKIHI